MPLAGLLPAGRWSPVLPASRSQHACRASMYGDTKNYFFPQIIIFFGGGGKGVESVGKGMMAKGRLKS